MKTNRRFFLRNGSLALASTAALPGFLLRAATVAPANATARRLVVVFQRGAADGLNIVIPYREPNYYKLRPGIGIPATQVLDLDGSFGLHPALAPFKPLYDAGHLGIVHAAGLTSNTRSHFDAQDFMETGTPDHQGSEDGWLNRALVAEDQRRRQPHTAFRALSLTPELPRTLAGSVPAIAMASIDSFNVGGRGPQPAPAASAFETMYSTSGDRILHPAGQSTFEALRLLRSANPAQYTPAAGVNYPSSDFGNAMRQIAQLLKSSLGVEVAFTDVAGWDTHQNQGGVSGQLAGRLTDFAQSIAAFWRDLGDEAENVTLVTLSEFGRTAKENGTGGTDHGHANAIFVLGGHIRGGKVHGRWPGLEDEQLNEGRDLALTTDYRAVLSELLTHTLGPVALDHVFPGFAPERRNPLHLT